jgi:hypothetical protein
VFLLILSLIAQTPSWRCGTPVFDAMKTEVRDQGLGIREPGRNQTPEPRPLNPVPHSTPPQLGDERTMWLQNMSVMPPEQYQASVTCRGTGDHVYVMVEDSAWQAGLLDSAGVARIIERFDHSSPRDSLHGVWYHNTTAFGRPPDALDHDSLIYLVYHNVGEFMGYSFDGFWQYFDEYYDTTAMRLWGYHSNEIECVYLDCYPNNPSQDNRIAIAAHEFEHMIHWNYDPAESLWVNEGCAELAMWLFGSPDAISDFNSNPDNDLTKWNGDWADYIKTYLWTLFLYEQYGDRGGNNLIRNIVASPFVSIAGVDSALAATGLPQRFEEVLDQWVLANVINDTSYLNGEYGYFGVRVPRFGNAGVHTTYPVSRSNSLDRWAGEYILFQRGLNLQVGFDGNDAANFHVFMVAKDTIGHRLILDTLDLDSQQNGLMSVPGSDTGYQSVWLVPSSHYPSGRMSYSYSATAVGIAEPDGQSPFAARPSLNGPTIMRAGTRLVQPSGTKLYSTTGRLVSQESPAPGVYWLEPRKGLRSKLVVVR